MFVSQLTGVLFVLAHLELHAPVELSGDETVGYSHHHSWDDEQDEEQDHIPEKTQQKRLNPRKV